MTGAHGTLDDGAALALAALGAVGVAAWHEAESSGWMELAQLVAGVCADQHGLHPLSVPSGTPAGRWAGTEARGWATADGLTEADRALLAFAQQFAVDVSAVTGAERSDLVHHWGDRAPSAAAVVFALDFLPRTSAALAALDVPVGGRGAPVSADGEGTDQGIWSALDTLIRTVPRLQGLDPVTTELVRLRGARQHRCRLCQSLRSRPALLAGADEALFRRVDHDDLRELSPLQTDALALTDAMIWTPARTGPAGRRLARSTTVSQRVEPVADITRNALNKIAVALDADAPHVDGGTEIYDIGPDGDLVYGLTLD